MDRVRSFPQRSRPLWCAMLLLATALGTGVPAAHAGRNILFIAIDDMRVDPQALTPNLDALAAQSTVYSNAYTTAPWCLPSRTSVMFGLSPATHKIGLTPKLLQKKNQPPYSTIYGDPNRKTLPEVLAANGYTTGVAGKVFHESEPSRWMLNGPPIPWDTVYDLADPASSNTTHVPYGVLPAGVVHPDQVVADWAAEFIQNEPGPFFLAVGFFQPHLPWIAPQWAYDMYPAVTVNMPVPGDLADEPAAAVAYAREPTIDGMSQYDLIAIAGQQEALTRAYLAAITHTDAMIGQLLAALASSGHADDTDVIVWSDHGYHLGEKFHWHKVTFWQEVVRVPLLIRSPNVPAVTVTQPVSLLDLAPTVLDLAGLSPFPQFEGVSLRTGSSPVAIYEDNARATVVGSTKTIDYDLSTPGTAHMATYNLAADPKELVNLSFKPPVGC